MLKRGQLSAFIVALSVWAVMVPPVFGAECLQAKFPNSTKVGNVDLELNGLGIRKATFLAVKVYVAGLYVPQKSSDAGAILGSNLPWQLTLRFIRDVDASDIRDAFEEGFESAAGEKMATLRPRIDSLNARMADFKEGQYLTFANAPAKGVMIDVNGVVGSAIEGADFSTALLSIWIGRKPPNEDLKSGLLGDKCK
jgi:Chalcone isomerase-like